MIAIATSEELWAEHGLTGLVLFASFGLLALFIAIIGKKDKAFLAASEKKDKESREFVSEILKDARSERDTTTKTTGALASAVQDLANSLREKE